MLREKIENMLKLSWKSLTKRNIEKKLEIFTGRLPNPYFKVFFIAISSLKTPNLVMLVSDPEPNSSPKRGLTLIQEE